MRDPSCQKTVTAGVEHQTGASTTDSPTPRGDNVRHTTPDFGGARSPCRVRRRSEVPVNDRSSTAFRRRADMRVTANQQPQHARALCRRHAATLFATATLLIDDTDKACDVVADAIAAACAVGTPIEPSSEQALTALVASVVRRCAALLGADESAATPASARLRQPAFRRAQTRLPYGNVRQRFGSEPLLDDVRSSRTGNRWMGL